MNNFFNTSERIEQLQRISSSWEGTPFAENASVKGVGVSCQKLVGEILRECGVFPQDFEVPNAAMVWGGPSRFVEDALDLNFGQFFQNIWGASLSGDLPLAVDVSIGGAPLFLPGDVIGLGIRDKTKHLAIMVTDDMFIHVAKTINTRMLPLKDATWSSRIVRAWRPQDVWQ